MRSSSTRTVRSPAGHPSTTMRSVSSKHRDESERGTEPRHILITNDDGIDADALPPLSEALSKVGAVDVIVPERNWSGASHTITLFRPLRVRPTKLRNGQAAYMTDRSPTDYVRLAALGLLRPKPDIVVSGINRGANLGDDITYSGTVAAAMEGLLSSIPSVAISIGSYGGSIDYGPGAAFAAVLARNILDHGMAKDALLNVNVPRCRVIASPAWR